MILFVKLSILCPYCKEPSEAKPFSAYKASSLKGFAYCSYCKTEWEIFIQAFQKQAVDIISEEKA